MLRNLRIANSAVRCGRSGAGGRAPCRPDRSSLIAIAITASSGAAEQSSSVAAASRSKVRLIARDELVIANRFIASSETPPIGSIWTAEPARRDTSGMTLTLTPASRRARITNISSSPPLRAGGDDHAVDLELVQQAGRHAPGRRRVPPSVRSARRRRGRRAPPRSISIAFRRLGSRLVLPTNRQRSAGTPARQMPSRRRAERNEAAEERPENEEALSGFERAVDRWPARQEETSTAPPRRRRAFGTSSRVVLWIIGASRS